MSDICQMNTIYLYTYIHTYLCMFSICMYIYIYMCVYVHYKNKCDNIRDKMFTKIVSECMSFFRVNMLPECVLLPWAHKQLGYMIK